MDTINRYIEAHRDRFVQELLPFVAQPSISATGEGIEACATMLASAMQSLGIRTEQLVTDGPPIVYGELASPAADKTLLLFDHYDVVPPGPLESWQSPPFQPVIRDNKIWARGAGDAKGQWFAYLKAIEAWQATVGELPINLRLVLTGDEEIGCPYLSHMTAKHPELFKADAVFFADASTLDVWGPVIYLGHRGILALEMIAQGPANSAHSSSYGGLVKNPALRLAQALASLRDREGRIQVKGFFDDLQPLGETERSLLAKLTVDRESKLRNLGTEAFWGDPGHDYFETQMYRPTLNIHGLSSGYQGQGWAPMVPSSATAKIDINIVPNLDHDDIRNKIRAHLDDGGFDDVELKELARAPYAIAATTDDPFLALVSRALKQVWGKDPVLYPSIGGGGTFATALKDQVGNPHFLMVPFGQPDMNEHSPRENLDIDWFIKGIATVATVISEFGKATL